MSFSWDGWTYGAEHEWGDWDRSLELLPGWGIDRNDHTIVNSDGTAADPLGKDNWYGGELQSPPVNHHWKLGEVMENMISHLSNPGPRPVVNYRSNLHIHIRVPGLREDLPALKSLADYNNRCLVEALNLVEPIRAPTREEFSSGEELLGALRRYRRRLVSHHTVLGQARHEAQMAATTCEEFFQAEVPRSKKGAVMWHAQPRAAVNVRQLLQTDTIEFRHFPGTLSLQLVTNAAAWCRLYLKAALNKTSRRPPRAIWAEMRWSQDDFPQFPKYDHWMEKCYRSTIFDGTIPRPVIRERIKIIRGLQHGDPLPWDWQAKVPREPQ